MTSLLIARTILLALLLLAVDYLILHFRRGGRWQDLRRRFSWTPRPHDQPSAPAEPATPQTEPANPEPMTETQSNPTDSTPAPTAHINISVDLPPETVLHITITTDRLGHASVTETPTPPRRWQLPTQRPAWFTIVLERVRASLQPFHRPQINLTNGLFLLALLCYLATRLIGLEDFPIYFFGDEAVQTVSAADLLERGLRGPDGTLLPTYFQNGLYFNLSASVYLQILPHLLFGNSIFVTRATSVLVTLLAAIFAGLMLRNFFEVKRWWLATILLSIVPAWFLHSRTAFETVLFVSFYTAFLYFYLDYRLRNPRQVFWAVIFAGLAFYSYSPGQLVLGVTGVLLFFSDLRYHWQQRKTLLVAIGLLALVAVPYIRFRLAADYSPLDHLRSLGSYLIQPLPLSQKIGIFASEYLRGLSPQYWFFDAPDMARHQMRGFGNIPLWFAPLMLTGVALAFWRWRSPAQRLLLLSALAAPAGAALAEIGITRILVFVVPASLLTALGLDWALTWLEQLASRTQRRFFTQPALGNLVSVVTLGLLVSFNIHMLREALVNGPTWYQDYGLYGMQYGAKQVYQETVVPALEQDPNAYYVVTPSWANGAEQFVGFFVPPELRPRLMLGQVYNLLDRQPLPDLNTYYIVSPEEFDKLATDPKFKRLIVRSVIPYPDGQIGFYILNIEFSDNLAEIMAAEDAELRKPVESDLLWFGQQVHIVHSRLGDPLIQPMLDGDPNSLIKGEQANPIEFEFFFEKPIPTNQLEMTTGSMSNFQVTVQIYPLGSETPIEYQETFSGLPNDPTIVIPFVNGPSESDHIRLTVRDYGQDETAQVHIREVNFK